MSLLDITSVGGDEVNSDLFLQEVNYFLDNITEHPDEVLDSYLCFCLSKITDYFRGSEDLWKDTGAVVEGVIMDFDLAFIGPEDFEDLWNLLCILSGFNILYIKFGEQNMVFSRSQEAMEKGPWLAVRKDGDAFEIIAAYEALGEKERNQLIQGAKINRAREDLSFHIQEVRRSLLEQTGKADLIAVFPKDLEEEGGTNWYSEEFVKEYNLLMQYYTGDVTFEQAHQKFIATAERRLEVVLNRIQYLIDQVED